MRDTLKNYLGQIVSIKCEYCKYDKRQGCNGKQNNVRLGRKYDGYIEIVDLQKHFVMRPCNVDANFNVTKTDYQEVIELKHLLKPISYIDRASCITNAKDVYLDKKIDEQHVNLQENIYDVLPGEYKTLFDEGHTLELEFDAKVYEYKTENRVDYGLMPVSQIIVTGIKKG